MKNDKTKDPSEPTAVSSGPTDRIDMTFPDGMLDTFNLVPGSIMAADARGTIQYVNPHGLKMSGYQLSDMVGLPLSAFWAQSPETSKKILSQLEQHGIWQGEIKHLCKDGSFYWETVSLSRVSCARLPKTIIIKTGLPLNPKKQTRIDELEKTCERLEEKTELYRTILDASPDPICLTREEDGKYIDVNTAFYKRTGFTPEQIATHTAIELNVYDDPAERNQLIRRLKKSGRIENMEVNIRTQNGSMVNDLWSLRLLEYKGESHLLLIARDYSQLRATQQALKESEASYRSILESAPYSIVITRMSDGHYMQVNESFCRRTGYSRDEAVGHTPIELGIFVDPKSRNNLLEMIKKNGHAENMEVEFRAKDGTILENLLSATLITYKGDTCLLTITVAIDELKGTQRALKESEHRYRNILQNMEEGYWEMDLKGRYTFFNEAECRIHRRKKEELLGKHSQEFSSLETLSRTVDIFKTVYKTGVPALMYDVEIIRSDGSIATIESSASLLKDAEKKPVGFFGISRDISEKRKTEKELEQYRKHLEQMVQDRTKDLETAQEEIVKREKLSVLGQLTATVSHELRNPLGVIQSSNFYLRRKIKSTNDKIAKHFKRIEDQVTLCDSIVADLLEYTRGRKVSVRKALLQPWLEKLIQEIEETQSINIERILPADLPPIPHDQEKMRRVFINLIENARHATNDLNESKKKDRKTYQPKISVTAHAESNQLVIEVTDNGAGMDEETCLKAFEPLFTTRARGTGIGLANVYRIITDHGGNISLTSAPGIGTTALINLPCELSEL